MNKTSYGALHQASSNPWVPQGGKVTNAGSQGLVLSSVSLSQVSTGTFPFPRSAVLVRSSQNNMPSEDKKSLLP